MAEHGPKPDLPELYAQAAELTGVDRERFLAALAVQSPAAAQEIQELLAAGESEADWLSGRAWLPRESPPPDDFPATIGPYRVLAELGRGGTGRVFLGEETGDGFVRRVAVKVLTGALADGEARERFRTEGRLLAGLEHPGIARLYDTGTTADGVPYLAMEYIDGADLTRYADARNLVARDRVELFLQVLDAVQFAHRHLIVHRDLKPANLLVDAAGRVKLLDFGIAKLLDESPGDASLTRTGRRWLTPAYAAPEQIRGEATTTAADIYSLGVVLYELLSGHRPHETTGAGLEAAILTTDPVPPSRAPGGGTRSTVPPVAHDLEGDLDAIVLFALRKEPESRYRSVEAFGEDLRRHLDGFPVAARQGTRRYRWGKFVHRNQRSLAAVAVVFLALTSGLGVALWQARKAAHAQAVAERRFADLQGLARAMIFEVSDAIAPLDGSGPAIELTIDRALEYLNRLEEDGDQDLLEELAAGYERVGRIASGLPVFGRGTGNWDKGDAAFRRALELRRAMAAGFGTAPEAQARLGRVLTMYCGALRARRDPPRAESLCREAISQFERLVAEYPDRGEFQVDLAMALAQQLLVQGALKGQDFVIASAELQQTGDLWLKLGSTASEAVRLTHNFAWGLASTSQWLRLAGRREDASTLAAWALRATSDPEATPGGEAGVERRLDRVQALEAAAFVHWDLGRHAEALTEFDQAYELGLSLRRKDRLQQQQILLFNLTGSIARLCGETGEVERGERALTNGSRLIDEAVTLWKPDTVTWSSGLVERDRATLYTSALERPGLSAATRRAYVARARSACARATKFFASLIRERQDPFGVGESISACREMVAGLRD